MSACEEEEERAWATAQARAFLAPPGRAEDALRRAAVVAVVVVPLPVPARADEEQEGEGERDG